MANILLTVHGTAGDITPMIRIGVALKTRGHRVTLITHGAYADLAQRVGLEFANVDEGEALSAYLQATPLLHTPQGQIEFFQRQTLPRVPREMALIRERSQASQTLIIANHLSGLSSQMAAEALGLPLIRVFIAVAHLTHLPFLAELCHHFLAEDINQLRAAFSLPAITNWPAWLYSPRWNLGSWPDWFAPASPTWAVPVIPAGFLTFNLNVTASLPEALLQSLHQGEPPILITGGTGMFIQPEFFMISAQACQQLGQRGLLVCQYPALVPDPLPDGIEHFTYLPLHKLMPHVAGVIHHGGTSTLAEALTAGVPQLTLAVGTDRPDTALRLQRLGVAEQLPPSHWNSQAVARALQRLINSPTVRIHCQELAEQMQVCDPDQVIQAVVEAALTDQENPARPLAFSTPTPQPEKETPLVSQTEILQRQLQALSPERRALMALQVKGRREAY